MGTTFRSALISAALLICSSTFAADAVPGEYVVSLKQTRQPLSLVQVSKALDGQVIQMIRKDVALVKKNASRNSENVLSELRSNPLVKIAEPNFIYKISKTPTDPSYSMLWGMSNVGGLDAANHQGVAGMDLNMEKAWDVNTGSRNVVVAVVDTGIDATHPDLKNNMWVNQAELNGRPGVDDDGNGYVDDVYGFDFSAQVPNGHMIDDNGHGTHCAGTIGAEGSNGVGVVGVNWNVRMMGVKFLDKNGSGSLANAILAIDYARKNGANIMSNSWGGGSYSVQLERAIQDANSAGILFIAAAGNSTSDNDTKPSYPASYHVDNVVSVAAVDNAGELAMFSNYGATSVHVAAPGVHIYSTAPNGLYRDLSGTSMATPHVSGVAALVLANDYCQSGKCAPFSPKEIRDRLINTSKPVAALRGSNVSNGMVDAYAALTNQKHPPDQNDPVNWTSEQDLVLSSAHPYVNSKKERFEINVPGAKEISVHFAKFETEAIFDSVKVLDANGTEIGSISGKQTGRYSLPYKSDKLTLVFQPDASLPGYGFDIDHVKYR